MSEPLDRSNSPERLFPEDHHRYWPIRLVFVNNEPDESFC